jgi:hypothetical protein
MLPQAFVNRSNAVQYFTQQAWSAVAEVKFLQFVTSDQVCLVDLTASDWNRSVDFGWQIAFGHR